MKGAYVAAAFKGEREGLAVEGTPAEVDEGQGDVIPGVCAGETTGCGGLGVSMPVWRGGGLLKNLPRFLLQ